MLEESIAYAQVRKTFGKAIGEHQAIQIKLADMATRVEAARLLTESAAEAYDTGERWIWRQEWLSYLLRKRL
ncbi:MAG: hypothetical protein CM1200mP41_36170 [Gammaproteobacteria bacterium]|nr:MAG: hypothetical protein CM1200mP41_36170 [Gammaproteobacteria bacterium]